MTTGSLRLKVSFGSAGIFSSVPSALITFHWRKRGGKVAEAAAQVAISSSAPAPTKPHFGDLRRNNIFELIL